MDINLNNFKHVLEYFVAHLNYVQSNYSESAKGYDLYIRPCKENNPEFKSSGQGWKNDNIQKQIENWEYVNDRKICINVQANFGDFTSRKCYLNWESTGINIFGVWDKVHNEVTDLSIGYAYWWCESTQYKILMTKSVDEMNLFNEDDDTSGIEEFYNKFTQEIVDYEEKIGLYYIKEKEYYEEKEKKNCESYLNLLKSNHNLILTGAPGTGKTYLAKQVAKIMIFGVPKINMTPEEYKQFKEQCEFVQFHPSYDYTDFVEGLRPTQDGGVNVGFELQDGVFKEFCERALKNYVDSKKGISVLADESSVEEMYKFLLARIENGEITEIPLKTKSAKMLIVKVSSQGNIILTPNSQSGRKYTVSLNRIIKLSKSYQDEKSLENISNISTEIRDIIGGCNASAYWGVLKMTYEQKEFTIKHEPKEVKEKKYIFIIDEINRGEISKIFGELFFSIDPGYRGKEGNVRTQYANMQTEPNEFDSALEIKDPNNYGHFFVPENVYIIGTMNDIDRSVESMDFAFRRRFAFKEIKATDRIQMLDSLDNKDDVKKRMENINECIEKIEGLSSAYHIGPAYFLKLKNYDGNFDQLWENHIEGLLFEYLRGMTDIPNKLKALAEAYGYSKANEYVKTSNN